MDKTGQKIPDNQKLSRLIKLYYESNPSSFDLEAFHLKSNEFSEFHQTSDQKKWTIHNSGINQLYRPGMFIDDTNEDYSLIEINELNFLINSKRAIPCSRLYRNIHGNFFITPFVIPNGEPIIFGGNLDNQIFTDDIMFYDIFFENIKDHIVFSQYIVNMSLSFRDNSWWSKDQSIFKRFVNYKTVPVPEERIKLLRKVNAYSFLDLLILVHTNRINFDLNEFLYIIFESKNYSGHNSFLRLKDYLSLTETSNQIIQNAELMDYFLSNIKSWADFKSFFELDQFFNSIDFSKIGMINMMDFEDGHTFNIPDKVVRDALLRIKNKFRSLENDLRLEKGYKIVGSFTQESILYKKLKDYFNKFKVVSQGSPTWLKPQRLDIYFPELNIGVEYQGLQHFKAVDYFGGEEGFLLSQKRDWQKRKKCNRNDCLLIEVFPNYDFNELILQIERHIKKRATTT